MSYAIAPTFEANKIGVRRMYTLGFLGASSDIVQGMIGEGYDAQTINYLSSIGATDAQLQNLWNNYAAGSADFNVAASQLASSLTGLAAPTSPAAGYPQAAVPTTVSSAWGVYDLTQEASWNAISGLFTTVQQQLNALARSAPNDPDVIDHVSQFNSLVGQWAGYYSQAFGSAPSPLPMASIPGGGSMSGTLGVIPVIIAGALVAGVVVLLASLYAIYTWGQTKKTQIAATQQVQGSAVTGAQNTSNTLLQQAAALIAQANSLPPAASSQAATLRAQAAVMQQQAANIVGQSLSTTSPLISSPSALTTWFTQNWIGVAAVIIGIAVLPGLIKKL